MSYIEPLAELVVGQTQHKLENQPYYCITHLQNTILFSYTDFQLNPSCIEA